MLQKRKLNLEKLNEKALKESGSESISLIEKANSISSVAGSLLQRNKSVDDGVKLVETRSSAATIFTAKVTDLEDHPNAVGVYQGAMSEDYTKNMIEQTDLVIGLGFAMTNLIQVYSQQRLERRAKFNFYHE